MPKYYHDKKDFKIIPKEDVDRLIGLFDRDDMKVLIALIWLTGARVGELLKVEKKHITITSDEFKIILETFKTKPRIYREIVFSAYTPYIRFLIIPYVEKSQDRLFHYSKRRYQQLLQKANKITGLYYTFHEFRHSRLSFLARTLRASVSEMMDWTGWKTADPIPIYVMRGTADRFKDKIE